MRQINTMESRFYYPLRVSRAGAPEYEVIAPFVPDLGPVEDAQTGVVILSLDKGRVDQGLYVSDKGRWRYAMPMPDVSNSVIRGFRVQILLDVQVPPADLPAGSEVFRNGSPYVGPITPGTDVWTIISPRVVPGSGTVTSVNNKAPDDQGNVDLDVGVKTVDNVAPDPSGNLVIDQFANYSISVPGAPNPDSVVFYQEFVDDLELLSGSCKALELPSTDIQFSVALNGAPAGAFNFGPSGGTANLTFTGITTGDILSIGAPSDLADASSFSFVLLFKRI